MLPHPSVSMAIARLNRSTVFQSLETIQVPRYLAERIHLQAK